MPTIKQGLLDGHSVDISGMFGYERWGGSGTIVQVNLPSGKVRGLHIAQCEYDMATGHPGGFTDEGRVL